MMKKTTKIIAAIFTIAVLAGVVSAWGLTNWTETGNFTPFTANESFQVNSNTASGLNVDLGTVSGTATRTYTVTNNGNVPINVTASASAVNADAALDKSGATLNVGASATFTLTLGNFTAAGTYAVTFVKA